MGRRVINRGIQGVSKFFWAPPAEATSLELETALTSVFVTGGNGLVCSITPTSLFRTGASKASSDEHTCISLVRPVVSPFTHVCASIRKTLEGPDAPVSIASDTTNVAGFETYSLQ